MTKTTEHRSSVPIKFEIDTTEVITQILGAWHYNPETDEEFFTAGGGPIEQAVVNALTERIEKDVRKKIDEAVQAVIEEQVAERIRSLINEGTVSTYDGFSGKVTSTKSLMEVIVEEIQGWFNKGKSTYDRNSKGNGEKLVDAAVTRAIQEDINGVLGEEREKFRARLRDLMTDTTAATLEKRAGR
jgi:predicted DNA-binding protein (UPF0278 family)